MHARYYVPVVTLALAHLTFAQAQNPENAPKPSLAAAHSHENSQSTRTFFLKSSDFNESNELLTVIRNVLPPSTKIYLVPSRNAVVAAGDEDQLNLTSRLIEEFDRSPKTYRLSFTFTAVDNNKATGTEHFSVIAVSGQHTVLREDGRIPYVSGKNEAGEAQYNFLERYTHLDVVVDEFATGVRLRSKIEQRVPVREPGSEPFVGPSIRESVLEGTSNLSLGKPLILGSLDVPGTARRIDIAVLLEPAP